MIVNKTKNRLPTLPFSLIKDSVLGKNYDLSLVFVGDKKSHSLNKKYKDKDKPASVLSFPLSNKEGEVFINLTLVKKEASSTQKSYSGFIGLLFVHSLFHLKGFKHGSIMDRKELEVRKKFNI